MSNLIRPHKRRYRTHPSAPEPIPRRQSLLAGLIDRQGMTILDYTDGWVLLKMTAWWLSMPISLQ